MKDSRQIKHLSPACMWQRKCEIFTRFSSRLDTPISKTERKQKDWNWVTRITTTKADLNCFGLLDNMFGQRIGKICLVICSNNSCGHWKSPELVLPSRKSISVPLLMPSLLWKKSQQTYGSNHRVLHYVIVIAVAMTAARWVKLHASIFTEGVHANRKRKKKCPWWYALLWSSYSEGVSQKCLVQKCWLMSLRCLYIQQL